MAAHTIVVNVHVAFTEDGIVFETLDDIFARQAGNARTVLEHYNHEYHIDSGHLASFYYRAPHDEWNEYLSAVDTYNTLVAS
jgi:hypothetical protein